MKKGNAVSDSELRICVVGGGIVGLTCAHALSRRHRVTIVADRFGAETDSIKATAVWHVYLVPETEQVLGWAAETLQRFHDIAKLDPQSGVELIRGVELYRATPIHTPSWAHIPHHFSHLSALEVESLNATEPGNLTLEEKSALRATPITWGYHIEAPAADMGVYLPWLENAVRENERVSFVRRHISQLEDVAAAHDVVVNCSGIGARELASDQDFEPYKGQYFVLRRDERAPTTYVGDDEHPLGMAYMIPRAGEVMVGGCAERGLDDYELTLDFNETVRRAGLYVPWLLERTTADQARPPVVGVRPCRRSGIRLEIDRAAATLPVIHNYGHGGSGFSLSWGCAGEVERLVDSLT
jgi:glycine/D-amino acid oxidase-like deaminating enzyme